MAMVHRGKTYKVDDVQHVKGLLFFLLFLTQQYKHFSVTINVDFHNFKCLYSFPLINML